MAEATGDLIRNKIADAVQSNILATQTKSHEGKIKRVSKNSQQYKSEIVTNEHDKEIPKERYVSPEERQEIIDELRLKQLKQYNNRI